VKSTILSHRLRTLESLRASVVLDKGTALPSGVVVDGFNEDVGGHEIVRVLLPGIEDLVLLQLVQGFALGNAILNRSAGFFEHLHVGANVIEIGDGSVPGDDFHIRRQFRNNLFHGGNHAGNAASAIEIDKRETVTDEIVAHVHDIGFGKEDDAVAVGVAAGEVQSANVVTVEVNRDVMIEGDDGQDIVRGRLELHRHGAFVAAGSTCFQALAHVVLGDDRGLLLEVCIPANVIRMVVRIDDEANGLVGDAFERRLDLVGEGSVLVVDDHNTVITHGRGDIATSAFEHVDVAGNLGDFNLNLAVVLILRESNGGENGKGEGNRESSQMSTPMRVPEL